MSLIVTSHFVGHGYNMPAPGTLIDPSPDIAEILIGLGVAHEYKTKVIQPPDEIKKKQTLSVSSRPGRAPTTRTRKSSKKSVTK